MVEAEATNRRGGCCVLAGTMVRAAVAVAADAERPRSTAGLDAGSGGTGAGRFGGAVGLAVGASASPMEPAKQADPHLLADRTCSGGAVRNLDDDLCVHRGRAVFDSSCRHAY